MAATLEERTAPSEVRLVIVIPGIGGSVLADGRGEVVWNARLAGIVRALWRPERLAIDEVLTPVGLIESTTLFPGFSVIHGYGDFVNAISSVLGWAVDWGNPAHPNLDAQVVAFPYDFRQGVAESAERLGELVKHRLGHLGLAGQPNRVLVVAHSMGGLVARRWVADGHWDVCRAIVTLGTPHRGAPKALKFLHDGAPWWTGRSKDVRELLRGWPAMYALLPRYQAVRDLLSRDSKYLYPADLPLPWLQQPAQDAFAMHKGIETEWKLHQHETDCLALTGIGHPTLMQSRWDGRQLTTVTEQLPSYDAPSGELGDGTVPALSALPIEQSNRLATTPQLPVRHSQLVTAKLALNEIKELLLTARPPSSRHAGGGLTIGLSLDDAVIEGEPAVGAAQFEPAELFEEELWLDCRLYGATEHGPVPQPRLEQDETRPWRWTLRLPGLARGEYRLEVTAASPTPRPLPARAIEEFFVVPPMDEDPVLVAVTKPAAEEFEGLDYSADLSAGQVAPLSDTELLHNCEGIRAEELSVTAELVERIVATQSELRQLWDTTRAPAPPVDREVTLWRLGWLFYESSWALTKLVRTSFDATDHAPSKAAVALIVRLSTSYVRLPWPQWAPRGLGALRAHALAESKRDTDAGFVSAWVWHDEAKQRYVEYLATTPAKPSRLRLGLVETMLQLALAETGTACRGVERTLGSWGEELLESADPIDAFVEQDNAGERRGMLRRLLKGVQFGRDALERAAEIEQKHGLVHRVDEERLAMVTAFQNPGIMTARACLLAMPLCLGLDGWRPPEEFGDWAEARAFLRDTFERAYRAIEREVRDDHGELKPFSQSFERPLMHIRTHFGLLHPGAELGSELSFADCLATARLDGAAVEAMCSWLADRPVPARRGEGNPIASVMMPGYIRLVERYRLDHAGSTGEYAEWRVKWFELDRYADDAARRVWLDVALAAATALDGVTPE